MEQLILFTVVGAALYLGADALLERIERLRGRRLPHRSLIFFALILTLALVSFSLIERALA